MEWWLTLRMELAASQCGDLFFHSHLNSPINIEGRCGPLGLDVGRVHVTWGAHQARCHAHGVVHLTHQTKVSKLRLPGA